MFFRIICSLMLLSIINISGVAQGVKISPSGGAPDPSAVLELADTSKGLLLTRLSTSQRNTIQNPPDGLVIYNTDNACFEGYTSGNWRPLACSCPSLVAGTIQTIPAQPVGNQTIQFSVSNPQSGYTYAWQFASGTPASGTGTQSSASFGQAGTYQVVLSSTDAQLCSRTDTFQVTVGTCPPNFPQSTFTPASGTTTSGVPFVPDAPNLNYAWTFQGGTPASSNVANPTVSWANAGVYNVSLIATDPVSGCADTTNSQITIVNFSCRNFSNAGATGRFGPSQAQVNSAYTNTTLQGEVTVSQTGIQEWTVPFTGTFRIECFGAQGGSFGGASGGQGARMRGDFQLTQGAVLRIMVGQQGTGSGNAGGGGGGSGVYTGNQVLIAAGGGGGVSSNGEAGKPGLTGNSGGNSSGTGGTNGSGGGKGFVSGDCGWGSGGGGWSGSGFGGNSGGDGGIGSPGAAGGGISVQAGGIGGVNGGCNFTNTGLGGFGFGGGGHGVYGGGGGGGYSGGGGGQYVDSSGERSGGGGGSFNNGLNPSNSQGVQTGHGAVTICTP